MSVVCGNICMPQLNVHLCIISAPRQSTSQLRPNSIMFYRSQACMCVSCACHRPVESWLKASWKAGICLRPALRQIPLRYPGRRIGFQPGFRQVHAGLQSTCDFFGSKAGRSQVRAISMRQVRNQVCNQVCDLDSVMAVSYTHLTLPTILRV